MILRAHTTTMVILLTQGFWLIFCLQSVAGSGCSSSPCQHGGTCLPDHNNNYYCHCTADRTGYHCHQWNLALFPQLKVYAGTHAISKDHHIFNGLVTQHMGYLTGVTFYARQTGKFWLDLWKNNGGVPGSYTLVFSKSFTVSTIGQADMYISPSVEIVQGLTVGVHSSTSLDNPLAVTVGAGYVVWRMAWMDGDFTVGTTTVSLTDNTDNVPMYMVPAFTLDIINLLPGCASQQELDVIDRNTAIGIYVHIFLGLTTKCAGRLSSISLYAYAAGTVYIDLWKELDSGTDHVLVFTIGIPVPGAGQHTTAIDEVVYVEEGWTYGTHRPESDINQFVLEDGKTDPDQPAYDAIRYIEEHEDRAWTPNVLRRSDITERTTNILRTPSLAIYITPKSVSQECEKSRSVPPMIPGPSEPLPGLTMFPGVNTPCAATVDGLTFYASVPGSFYMVVFKSLSETDTYSLNFMEKVSVNETGLHQVTLQNQYFLNQGDVLGIVDGALSPNALRYVENTDLLKAAMEYDNITTPAHHLALDAEDLSVDAPDITVNASTVTTVHFPPLQLHLEYGIV